MNIEERINAMHDDDLERLLRTLNFSLSGCEIGEADAFALLAGIEAMAIKEKASREPEGWIPDEQLAGYIA